MLIVAAAVALLVVAYFVYLGQVSRSGSAAGLVGDRLTPCPASPNCVCSEDRGAAAHFVEPLAIGGTPPAQALQLLAAIVEQQGGQVVTAGDDYLAATFASSMFGFVDDVEFRADAATGLIHLRSASRVGHSDLGANRKRAEAIRLRLRATLDDSA